ERGEGARIGPVPRQELVEQDDISRHVLDLTLLDIKRGLGRGNEQAEHESGDCADEAGAQPHDILRIVVRMVPGSARRNNTPRNAPPKMTANPTKGPA